MACAVDTTARHPIGCLTRARELHPVPRPVRVQPRDAPNERRKTAVDAWIGVGALRDRDRTDLGEWLPTNVAKGDNLVAGRRRWALSESAAQRRRDGDWLAVAHG